MPFEPCIFIIRFPVVRELQIGDIPLEAPGVYEIQNVRVLFFMLLRIRLGDFALADTGDTLEENLIVFFKRLMKICQLRFAPAEIAAELRRRCVINVIPDRW